MSTSFFGYHVLGDGAGVADVNRLLTHVRQLRPRWMLVLNNPGLATVIKDASPSTEVVMRHHLGGDGYWLERTPDDFINHALQVDPQRRFWHMGANEVGRMDYDANLIETNIRRKQPIKLFACNYWVGSPELAQWESRDGLRILKGASDHPECTVLSFHDGYYMGWPGNGWDGDAHRDVKPETWPIEHGGRTNWIVGRHKMALAALQKHYPTARKPRFVMGEGGPESVASSISVLGTELKGGWRNHADWWREKWGLAPDVALYVCCYWQALAAYYANEEVEGVLLFCYGWNGDPRWLPFNIEPLTTFQELLRIWELPKALPQLYDVRVSRARWWDKVGIPPQETWNMETGKAVLLDGASGVYMRESIPSGKVLGVIRTGDDIGIAPFSSDWLRVKRGTVEGFASAKYLTLEAQKPADVQAALGKLDEAQKALAAAENFLKGQT